MNEVLAAVVGSLLAVFTIMRLVLIGRSWLW